MNPLAQTQLSQARASDLRTLKVLSVCHYVLVIPHVLILAQCIEWSVRLHRLTDGITDLNDKPISIGIGPSAVLGIGIVSVLLNLLSGISLHRARFRIFSLVVASVNCVLGPFGLILGVFTIVILLRDSVSRLYEEKAAATAPQTDPEKER